jgi:hypothetical protein
VKLAAKLTAPLVDGRWDRYRALPAHPLRIDLHVFSTPAARSSPHQKTEASTLRNRQVKNSVLRQQTRVKEIRRDSWGPEIAGFMLLTVAVLTSAGVIG